MGMSDGSTNSALTRIAFEVGSETYNFAVNPASIIEKYPARIVTSQTQDNTFVQGYGQGLHTIQISGHTGWAQGAGLTRIKKLREILTNYENNSRYGGVTSFNYYDYTNGYNWVVVLDQEGFQLEQSSDTPLLTNYTINMIVIRSLSDPTSNEISTTTLGNTTSSVPKTVVSGSSSTKYTKSVAKKTKKSSTTSKLSLTGNFDKATIKALQRKLGTPVDGAISKDSLAIRALQRKLGVTVDGVIGVNTIKAWQRKLGVTASGQLDTKTVLAIQKALNQNKLW